MMPAGLLLRFNKRRDAESIATRVSRCTARLPASLVKVVRRFFQVGHEERAACVVCFRLRHDRRLTIIIAS
jgi:hypothetical protein